MATTRTQARWHKPEWLHLFNLHKYQTKLILYLLLHHAQTPALKNTSAFNSLNPRHTGKNPAPNTIQSHIASQPPVQNGSGIYESAGMTPEHH